MKKDLMKMLSKAKASKHQSKMKLCEKTLMQRYRKAAQKTVKKSKCEKKRNDSHKTTNKSPCIQ